MVTWGSALVKHCQSIEAVIAVERLRLQAAKDQLKSYGTNTVFEKEREELKMIDDRIRWCRRQAYALTNEYEKLRRGIADAECHRIDEAVFTNRKRSMKVAAAETESIKIEIEKLDRKLREMREANSTMEKDHEKKLKEFNTNHGFIMKPRSSGCLQLGRLMMEQEDAKHMLSLANDKKTRLQCIIRELRKSLTLVEKECNLHEEEIRKKGSEEIERNTTLLEGAYRRHKETNDRLQLSLADAREKLKSLEKTRKEMQLGNVEALRMKVKEDERQVQKYRGDIAALNLVASTLHEDLVEMTRKKNHFAENFMKNYEETMRRVNVEISKMKSENTELDGRIENVMKGKCWSKNYEDYAEKQMSEENEAERLLTKFRVEERDGKEKLQGARDTLKKANEQVECLLDVLFKAQWQCYAKERLLEEMSNGLWEIKTVNETATKGRENSLPSVITINSIE